ncbi:hypothetical protein ACFW84_38090 [Streptomyces anulatus]|uniref:hypothetical protein n=1 Tax=Streptomyces anulatus TaxID=1892 RepID=UPI00368C804F
MAIILGVGLLGEPLHAVTIIAVALILCAAVLTQKPSPSTTRQERGKTPTPETVTARPQE